MPPDFPLSLGSGQGESIYSHLEIFGIYLASKAGPRIKPEEARPSLAQSNTTHRTSIRHRIRMPLSATNKGKMSSGTIQRDLASDWERSSLRRAGLLLVFVLLGVTVGVGVTLLSYASGLSLLSTSLALVGGIPLLVLLLWLAVQAVPQVAAQARLLAENWRWWHLQWFFLFAGMLVFRIRDSGAANNNPLDANAILRLGLEAVVAVSLIVRLVVKKPQWLNSLFRGLVGAMAIYCVACVVSTAWSVKAWWTAYKSLEFLTDVSLLAAIVASAESWLTFQSLVDWTLGFYAVSLLAVWINLPIWPQEAFDGGRLTGVFPVEGSNSVGTTGAVLALVAICRLMPTFGQAKDRALYALLFTFGMVSMILSQTRNAEAAFVFGLGLIVLFSPKIRKVSLMAGVCLAPILAATFFLNERLWKKAGEMLLSFLERDQSAGALDSLSGRTAWWAYGLHQLAQHPLTGIGAYGGRFAVLDKLGVGAAAMMHSDWIEVVIGTSLWGLIPFTAACVGTWWFLIRCIRSSAFSDDQRQLALELLSLLGMLTLHSFFNNELSWHAPLLYFSILAYAEFIRRSGKPGGMFQT
jgi:O-Antigen ligase